MIKKVTTFGEIMLRLSPVEKGERLTQATYFRIETGGSESNVAIALSNLGLESRFITRLPDNVLTDKIIQSLIQFGVDTTFIKTGGDKVGIYWTENGIGPRNSFVIYDRDNTSFCQMSTNDFNWEEIFQDTSWFHFSGISPAISENVKNVLLDAIQKVDIPYSVDLNYRENLWKWVNKDAKLITEYMRSLCKRASLIAGNESDFQDVLGIHPDSENNYTDIATKCFEQFPNLKYISISNREALSASTNIWNGFLFVKDKDIKKIEGLKYNLESIMDRVGTGDSFVAGIIYGLLNDKKYSYQKIIDFATTLAALNHTTIGDASRFSADEVRKVIANRGTGRIIR
ncbi:sugar kinase [Polaribacter porphyrae]|uniref:Carbohydrate kinase PfkB domain-containing protein n=1 Tax=Polaribacter porphyrae TaxID=1137780 RepID=A0A2S7WJJ4_9FLAO|nr:sugar kinase [Polaribacter porphyrae]PQJ77764.1 hypothetical protein BTO18_00545 [Polaribacter porphyrae]